MNEVNVGSYTNLENAVTLNNAYVTQIDNAKEFGKKACTQLSDDRIFTGHVQDECVNLIGQVNDSLDTLSDNFKKLAKYLSAVTENYKAADSNASKVVNSIGN